MMPILSATGGRGGYMEKYSHRSGNAGGSITVDSSAYSIKSISPNYDKGYVVLTYLG